MHMPDLLKPKERLKRQHQITAVIII